LSQLPKKLNRRSPLYVAVMAGSLATAGVAVATLAGCEGGIKKAAEVPSAVALQPMCCQGMQSLRCMQPLRC